MIRTEFVSDEMVASGKEMGGEFFVSGENTVL